jgi:hypothetical protein
MTMGDLIRLHSINRDRNMFVLYGFKRGLPIEVRCHKDVVRSWLHACWLDAHQDLYDVWGMLESLFVAEVRMLPDPLATPSR